MIADTLKWKQTLDALADALAHYSDEGWLVGGCIRDALLGLPVADVDVAITVEPLPIAEQLARQPGLAVARLGHGTIRLAPRQTPQRSLDLTPLQGDDIVADLARRDFTVNAMALSLAARGQWIALNGGQTSNPPDLIDPYSGRADLAARRLIAVSPAIFLYDPGRIIRAARLRARLALVPDSATLRLAHEAAPLLATLPADRRREEMARLLALPSATVGLELLDEVGALASLYPGLSGTTATHALATVRQADKLIGFAGDEDKYPALRQWSASDARRIALRETLLAHARDAHGMAQAPANPWQRARAVLEVENDSERFYAARLLFALARKTEAAALDALLVAAACALAGAPRTHELLLATRAEALVDSYLRNRALLTPPPLLTGQDLIAALALPPGPAIGQILDAVRRAQLADDINDREAALALARRLAAE